MLNISFCWNVSELEHELTYRSTWKDEIILHVSVLYRTPGNGRIEKEYNSSEGTLYTETLLGTAFSFAILPPNQLKKTRLDKPLRDQVQILYKMINTHTKICHLLIRIPTPGSILLATLGHQRIDPTI